MIYMKNASTPHFPPFRIENFHFHSYMLILIQKQNQNFSRHLFLNKPTAFLALHRPTP